MPGISRSLGQRFHAVRGKLDLVAARTQQDAEVFAVAVVVVDDEDAAHLAGSVAGARNCSTSATKVSGSIGFSM
jgi:hypothetical protein